ncbi:MAG: hypothetical protein NTZ59_03230 [Bacteroidetes bacterium]|nr:hypothetical protein [Bacteroidota bacterium]
MRHTIAIIFLFITIVSYSQTKKVKPQFSSINSVGTVWGVNQNVFCFETINGISYKNWVYGVGVSFDSYGSQSTPIFLDIRKQMKNSSVFVYADAGINIPWRTSNFPEKYSGTNTNQYKLKNTFYGEAGIGLKKLIANKTSFIASIGYSYKTFSYVQQNVFDWRSPSTSNDYNYDFYYSRIALRLGIQF